jgi:hypothetical protein
MYYIQWFIIYWIDIIQPTFADPKEEECIDMQM